jgi:hypothetical protein
MPTQEAPAAVRLSAAFTTLLELGLHESASTLWLEM